MSATVYEFPEINASLEGTVVVKNEDSCLYFPQDYMQEWDGGGLDESEAMNVEDGRIGDDDAEIIQNWLDKDGDNEEES